MKRFALIALLICLTASAFGQSSHEERLAALKALKLDAATVTLVQREEAPARTIVKLVLNPAKGSNINVEIWLPDAEKWNGRFLGLGNGGSAGRINSGSLAGPMAGGFAVATTDMGMAPNADSGIGNREVWKDFGFRATHLMTVAAKQVIASYYGKGPELSYFSGGSTGGQQGLQEAQRYPEDYDGIVAGIPAHCRTPLHAYFLWNDQILNRRSFTKEQEAGIVAAGNEYMASRGTPPAAGKFVSDSRCNSEDIAAVIALARKKDPTLTEEHAEALRKLFEGPRHAVTGARIFNGIPFGSSIGSAHGHLYLFKWVFGAGQDLQALNFGADIDKYTAALGPFLNAENADLSAFEKRGGKIVITTGAVDSVVPPHATIDYYERVIEHFGGLEKAQSFCRLYLIPGMAHGGGPGIGALPNMLELVKKWREEGTAPDDLTGRRVVEGKTVLEMPLYPYPSKAGWDAEKQSFKREEGPRGGVERVAAPFRPAAAE